MKTLYWYNTGFDLQFDGHLNSKLRSRIDLMTFLGVMVAREDDVVLVSGPINRDWLSYLRRVGFPVPQIVDTHDLRHFQGLNHFEPWGWNEQAVEIMKQAGLNDSYPSLGIIRKINSRIYHGELRKKLGCRLESWVYQGKEDLNYPLPLLLKPEHSSSAAGCVRLYHNEEVNEFLAQVDKNQRKIRYCVESCKNRKIDFSVGLVIAADGNVKNIQVRWLINNTRGAFRALVFGRQPDLLSEIVSELEMFAKKVAHEVWNEGFWGPIAFDGMIYEENGEYYVQHLLEINARQTMAVVANSLKEKFSVDSCALVTGLHEPPHAELDLVIPCLPIEGHSKSQIWFVADAKPDASGVKKVLTDNYLGCPGIEPETY